MNLNSTSGEQRAKKKRSRSGCSNCRERKVKCDERPHDCRNCERLHLVCSGYVQQQGGSSIGQRLSRSQASPRTYRACNECRSARSKCSGERPVCARCLRSGTQCSFDNSRQHDPSRESPSTNTPATQRESSAALSSNASHLQADRSTPLSWLSKPELPDHKQIRVLLSHYFQKFHTLRCFAFIHKPSFLRRFDDECAVGSHKTALLHIMCCLGAQFYALDYSETVQPLPPKVILLAGSRWARTAQSLLLERIDKISVENLMTTQLLYDYALRVANFAQAFMLSAMMVRMTQALQINLEYSTDVLGQFDDEGLSTTARESRRRLMWSCYITDALCGSGVDQLTLINDHDLKIQLPCDEQSFLHERPCITRMLDGSPLSFIPLEHIPLSPKNSTSMVTYFIQHVETRKRVLKYIKHLDKASMPWLPNSEFAILDSELQTWHTSLPAEFQFTSKAIYLHKETNQEGALSLLHCAFHQTMCDLYRLGAPALYKLRSAFHFPPEQNQFLRHLQWSLFKAATNIAAIIAEAGRHGPATIADTWLPSITYDSNRIMLYYLTTIFDPTDQSTKDLVLNTVPYLQSNVQALKAMRTTNAIAEGMYHAANSMLEKLGVVSNNISPQPNVILDDPYLATFGPGQRSAPGTPPQAAPDYVLNPLSIFRMARNDVPERHAPENNRSTPSGIGSTASSEPWSTSPSVPTEQNATENLLEFFGPELDTFFKADLLWDWQPMETAVGSGMDSHGLLPWVRSSPVNDITSTTSVLEETSCRGT